MPDPRPLGGDAPLALVRDGALQFGAWRGIPGSANLLDHERPYHLALPRAIRDLRLKEWQAIQAGNEEIFAFAVLYNAKFLSMVTLSVWDRVEKKKYSWRHIEPGSRFHLPRTLYPEKGPANTSIRTLNGRCVFSFDANAGRATFDAEHISRRHGMLSCAFEFDLRESVCAPFSVSLPFDLNRGMYSTKILMPMRGEMLLGTRVIQFDPATSTGIFDDHKGYYPYRLHYDWVTGFGMDESGARVGFNITVNQARDPERNHENRLWIGNQVFDLPPVKITRPHGRTAPWNIQDTEGMVDLVFIPENSNDILIRAGIVDIDYAGPVGRFEGRLRSRDGHEVNASRIYGMGEDKNVRL